MTPDPKKPLPVYTGHNQESTLQSPDFPAQPSSTKTPHIIDGYHYTLDKPERETYSITDGTRTYYFGSSSDGQQIIYNLYAMTSDHGNISDDEKDRVMRFMLKLMNDGIIAGEIRGWKNPLY